MAQENMAKYYQVKPASKKQSAQLTSSNSIVGNQFLLKIDPSKQQVKIENKFNHAVAQLNKKDSQQIILWKNKGLELKCMLAYVTFCEPKSQHEAYFLICAYPKKHKDAYDNFIENVSNQLSNGNIPEIKLDKFEQNKIVETKGDFKLTKFLPKPNLEVGTVIVKSKQTLTEKIIEAGRQRKPGCYIASIIFIITVLSLIALLLKTCAIG